jgi:hypothetical protein
MRYCVVVLALFLAGCQTVPTQRNFPDAVPELMKSCSQLQQVPEGKTAITDLLKVVVSNYTLYYECSNRVDGWKDWYTKQKKTYEEVK